ncbi:MAG: cysteine desulfurase family protein [Acidimicrobiales bacterium]
MIYLDCSSTTIMPPNVLAEMIKWTNQGNPSSSYASATRIKKMFHAFRAQIYNICNINPEDYAIIFTSCASESNTFVLNSIIDAYTLNFHTIPHIITSSIEHKCILSLCEYLVATNKAQITFIDPVPSGHIEPAHIIPHIRPNTCMISIIHGNNETGAINNIAKIGNLAHSRGVLFHTDTVQTFGKFPIDPDQCNVDAFPISFHKLYGPPGVGALVIRQKLLKGFKLHPLIFGTQNDGLRGGTENTPGIGASFEALKYTMNLRTQKNSHLQKIKYFIINEISTRVPSRPYPQYLVSKPPHPEIQIVFLSGYGPEYLPNIILLSIVKQSLPYICNTEIKKELESKGIIVSIGSACNTTSPTASHVLYALKADELVRKGTLRISFCDTITKTDALEFVKQLILILSRFH